MNEENPSPKPKRGKRLALRFAVFVAAVSVLGAAYWFTRPPELVWWTSPEIEKTGRYVRVLVPNTWKWSGEIEVVLEPDSCCYEIEPVDRRPRFIRMILPSNLEHASVKVQVGARRSGKLKLSSSESAIKLFEFQTQPYRADRCIVSDDGLTWANVYYVRRAGRDFAETYRQICNSLRIE